MERKWQFDLRIGGCDVRKCGILGCGRLGATVAYTLMQTGWFSDIVLIDSNYRIAEAEATDLTHAIPFHAPVDIYAGDYADLSDCGLVILAPPTSADSATQNVDQAEKQIRMAMANLLLYNQDAVLLNACEPSEALTQLLHRFSDYPSEHILGVGTLPDTARLKQMVGRHLGVDSRNVHSFIIGEHGEDEIPVWSSANVSGVDLGHYCDSCGKGYDRAILDGLFRDVRDSACRIASAKGIGFYAVAESVKRIASAIVHDEHTILTVTSLARGHYGLENVCLSLPCMIGRGGIRQVLEIPLNEDEEMRLRKTAKRLAEGFAEV
ncbi:MAG: L-lactate dehydrogenase [Clostridia bacterium]|nr:L-lactate dehydrogenase [Clostridia bacterium]